MVQGAPGLPGISRVDAAAFILEGFGNTLRGRLRRLILHVLFLSLPTKLSPVHYNNVALMVVVCMMHDQVRGCQRGHRGNCKLHPCALMVSWQTGILQRTGLSTFTSSSTEEESMPQLSMPSFYF